MRAAHDECSFAAAAAFASHQHWVGVCTAVLLVDIAAANHVGHSRLMLQSKHGQGHLALVGYLHFTACMIAAAYVDMST
jgi:hypothetical protein